MDQFAVLHINKYKGNLGGIGAHIDRNHIPENANPNKVGFNEAIDGTSNVRLIDILGNKIDSAKTNLADKHNSKVGLSLYKSVWKRIQEGHTIKTAIRKDAVLALGIILTGSHEKMMQIQADIKKFNDWKKANYDFVCQVFGKENIVRFVLHLDEKTPHFHCIVVPISKEGRLSARSYINGAEQLRAYQDKYAAVMSAFGLGRGISNILSHRVHLTNKDYYKAVQNLAQQTQILTSSIKKSNLLKLDHIREKISENVTRLKVALLEQTTKNQHIINTNTNLIQGKIKLAYQKKLEEDSHQAYERVKKEIPLVPFLTSQLGWTIDKTKSTKKDTVLSHPKHSKIIVPNKPKSYTGHWVYSDINGEGGTLIDLLLADKWTWKQIKTLSEGKLLETMKQIVTEKFTKENYKIEHNTTLQTQQAQKHLDTLKSTKGKGFFSQRNITQDTYKNFQGVKIGSQSAAFALYKDLDNSGKAQLCSTITYYKDRLGNHAKYFQKGLPRGLSILQDNNTSIDKAKRIVITESPVDALSYKKLELTDQKEWRKTLKGTPFAENHSDIIHNTAFISTCGNLSQQIKRDFEQVFQLSHQNNQTIVLALDNDIAGKKMTETLSHMLEEADCNYRIEVPKQGKDWNETLVMGLTKLSQINIETSKLLANKQWEIFEESTYETSLLKNMGVEESTFIDFQKNLKINQQTVLVALRKEITSESAITATWTLNWNPHKGLKEYKDLDTAPALSILKGDFGQSQQIVLVSSPMDALLHYQKEIQAVRSDQGSLGEQEIGMRLSKLDLTCYVYADSSVKQELEEPLRKLLNDISEGDKQLILACSKGHEQDTEILGQALQNHQYEFIKDTVDLPDTNQTITANLNRSISFLAVLGSVNATLDDEDYEEDEPKKRYIKRKI